MSNNKKSSVEWLYEKLLHCELNILEWQKHLEQAKAMHKEEIIEARVDGDTWSTAIKEMRRNYAELYYHETFGGNNDNP